MQSVVYGKITNSILEEIPEAIAIYLFGSPANGTLPFDSDFDLGILLPQDKPINDLKFFKLQQEIAVLLYQDFDLICLHNTTLVRQFQITSNGNLLYEKDRAQVLKFKTLVLYMYQRINEERRFSAGNWVIRKNLFSMNDDVKLNKISGIEHCLNSIKDFRSYG